MIADYDEAPGWPTEATLVHREPAGDLPRLRLRPVELFPVRYDNRPLHLRALERRVPTQRSWEALLEERRRYG